MRGSRGAITLSSIGTTSLRSRLTLAFALAIGVALGVVIGWWLSLQPSTLTDGTSSRPWMLLAALAVASVAGAGGWLSAVAVLAPLRGTERSLRAVSTLDALSERVRSLPDPDLRAVLIAAVSVARGVDARARSKALFFGALVHDFKTRVAGLMLMTERWPEAGSREQALVSRELSALSGWLRRVLDAVRVDQLDGIGERQATDLRALVEASVRELVDNGATDVIFDVDGGAIVAVDRDEMMRALRNLLANASRAARHTVSVQVFPGLVRISDDGPGLPRPFEVLVEPYSRATHPGGRNTTTGTGLGLFIAKRILELHGGKLVCERTGPNGTVLLAYLGASRER